MKIKLEINKIKEAGVALEGVAVELDCSASEVIKVLAGVKTLIEEPTEEVVVKLSARDHFDAKRLAGEFSESYTVADIKTAMPKLFGANAAENIIKNAKSVKEEWHAISIDFLVIRHINNLSDDRKISSFIIEELLEAYEFFFEK